MIKEFFKWAFKARKQRQQGLPNMDSIPLPGEFRPLPYVFKEVEESERAQYWIGFDDLDGMISKAHGDEKPEVAGALLILRDLGIERMLKEQARAKARRAYREKLESELTEEWIRLTHE